MRHLLFFASLQFIPFEAYALPMGNPSSPLLPEEGYFISKESIATLEVAYVGDWVFDRSLKFTRDKVGLNDRFSNAYSQTQSGRLSVNFADRVELHIQLGNAQMQFSQFPNTETKIDYTTKSCFSYGAFTNILLAYWGNIDMGISAGYLGFSTDMQHVEVNGQSLHPTPGHLYFQEWAVGVGFSYKMPIFVPYIGLDYSNVLMKIRNVAGIEELSPYQDFAVRNKHPLGIFLGCSLSPFKGFSLNVETRVVDQLALTLNAKFRF